MHTPKYSFLLLTLLAFHHGVYGFRLLTPSTNSVEKTRQSFVQHLATVVSASLIAPQVATASGGATAGGAYLLSAKQRYNDRVLAGVKGFVALGAALEKNDMEAAKIYFGSENVGSWKDFMGAGYLLSNAFRRNSSAAPDTLPSVKVSNLC
jgi:hypothetical protein